MAYGLQYFVKLLHTNNIETVKASREYLSFELLMVRSGIANMKPISVQSILIVIYGLSTFLLIKNAGTINYFCQLVYI